MADFSGDDAFNVFVCVRALRYAGGNYPGEGGGGGGDCPEGNCPDTHMNVFLTKTGLM